MTELAKSYVESVASGSVPDEESEEAKEFRAWSWAQTQLQRIKESNIWDWD